MAVGCTHGHFMRQELHDQILAFRKAFAPEVRFDLGDLVDTAAFRGGSAGSADECEDPRPDQNSALNWLESYEPTHIAWGNHCWRLWELSHHPKAIIATAASTLRTELEETANSLRAETRPYHIRDGWFQMGGVHWGHGYMINVNAVRDHAETIGGPVVIAHLHKPEAFAGRTLTGSVSYCVGSLADFRRMTYAHRRRATLQWAPGVVYGEVSDTDSRLHLATGKPWSNQIDFPPGVL